MSRDAAEWADAARDMPQMTRRDLLRERADLHPDDTESFEPGPITPAIARWAHQGSPTGCEDCGERCDTCQDRMCSHWGPEPRSCGTTCGDCPCDCTACWDARIDLRAELLRQIEREKDIA